MNILPVIIRMIPSFYAQRLVVVALEMAFILTAISTKTTMNVLTTWQIGGISFIHNHCRVLVMMNRSPSSRSNFFKLFKNQIILSLNYRSNKRAENGEKRPSSARVKKAQVIEEDMEIDDIEMPLIQNKIKAEPSKRGRKRKIQPVVEVVEKQEQEDGPSDAKMRIVENFLHNYGPQLNYSFNLWTQNSKILDKASVVDELSENPLNWTLDEVCTYIVKFCNEETTAKFYAQKIDGEALLSLCQKDLVELMDIKVGPAIKIYNRILHLRQEVVTKFLEI